MVNYLGFNDFVYVERVNNPILNRLIRENLDVLTNVCNRYDKRFVYLPVVLSYNMPGAEIAMESVYAEIADNAGVNVGNQGFIFYEFGIDQVYHEIDSENIDILVQDMINLLTPKTTSYCASMYESEDVCADMAVERDLGIDDDVAFRIVGPEEEKRYREAEAARLSRRNEEVSAKCSKKKDNIFKRMFSRSESSRENSEEIDRISEEVREKIVRLKELGVDYSSLLKLVGDKPKLSRLVVTENYHIILPEYGDMEIEMRPMAKALYFLFLKHPEGIVFKDLPDYRDELRKIYGKVSNLSSGDAQTASVEAVTNPLLNTVNVNCSRIREAFFGKFKEDMAMAYVINGKRGEAKRVELEPDMIEWRCDL